MLLKKKEEVNRLFSNLIVGPLDALVTYDIRNIDVALKEYYSAHSTYASALVYTDRTPSSSVPSPTSPSSLIKFEEAQSKLLVDGTLTLSTGASPVTVPLQITKGPQNGAREMGSEIKPKDQYDQVSKITLEDSETLPLSNDQNVESSQVPGIENENNINQEKLTPQPIKDNEHHVAVADDNTDQHGEIGVVERKEQKDSLIEATENKQAPPYSDSLDVKPASSSTIGLDVLDETMREGEESYVTVARARCKLSKERLRTLFASFYEKKNFILGKNLPHFMNAEVTSLPQSVLNLESLALLSLDYAASTPLHVTNIPTSSSTSTTHSTASIASIPSKSRSPSLSATNFDVRIPHSPLPSSISCSAIPSPLSSSTPQ